MEQHDAALSAWQAERVTHRTLVHIDAHHDMWWVDEPDDVTIASFIAPAIATGMVRDVFWVVPDPAWESGPADVARVLGRVAKGYAESGPVRRARDRVTVTLLGRTITACPLASLPRIDDDVLLDIDVDYLLIPQISSRKRDRHTPIPWCWPDQLCLRLAGIGVRSDLVTIAYSVDGGYTPLRWKYLGDELKARIANPAGSTAAWDLMKRGAVAEHRGDQPAAATAYREARSLLPNSAAPVMALAHAARADRRLPAARDHYRTALTLDPSYRTPFASQGFPALWDRDLRDAEREFAAAEALDPGDPYAALGRGLVAASRKHWDEAERLIRAALAEPGCAVDAHRALGRIHQARGRTDDAIADLEASLLLALKGQAPVRRVFTAHPPVAGDPDHGAVHARLARLYARRGNLDRAISGYQIARAAGWGGPFDFLRLVWWRMRRLVGL